MNDQDFEWLKQHESLLYVSTRVDAYQTGMVYDIYNRLTGEQKKPNGCGACLRNTIRQIRYHYELKKLKQG